MPGYVYRRAQLRGLLGGSRPWTILWIVLFARRLIRRFAGDKPSVDFSEELAPGQAFLITNGDAERL